MLTILTPCLCGLHLCLVAYKSLMFSDLLTVWLLAIFWRIRTCSVTYHNFKFLFYWTRSFLIRNSIRMIVLEHMQLLMQIDGTLPPKIGSNSVVENLRLSLVFLGPICTLLSILAFCAVNANDFDVLIVTMYNVIGVSLCISLNVAFCCQSNNMRNFIMKLDAHVNESKYIRLSGKYIKPVKIVLFIRNCIWSHWWSLLHNRAACNEIHTHFDKDNRLNFILYLVRTILVGSFWLLSWKL